MSSHSPLRAGWGGVRSGCSRPIRGRVPRVLLVGALASMALLAGCSGDSNQAGSAPTTPSPASSFPAGQGIPLASTAAATWAVGDAGFGQAPAPIEGFSQATMDVAVNYSKSLLTYGHLYPETVFGQSTKTFDAGVLPGNQAFIAERAPGVDTVYLPGTWVSQFGPGVTAAGDIRVNGRWTATRKDFGSTPNMSLLWEGTFAYPVTANGVETTVVVSRFLSANWIDNPASTPGLNGRGSFLNVDTCALQSDHRWYFPANNAAAAESIAEILANPYDVAEADIKTDEQLEPYCPTPSATPLTTAPASP